MKSVLNRPKIKFVTAGETMHFHKVEQTLHIKCQINFLVHVIIRWFRFLPSDMKTIVIRLSTIVSKQTPRKRSPQCCKQE